MKLKLIKNLPANKSSGTDSFTGKLYQTFREKLTTVLLKLFQKKNKKLLREEHSQAHSIRPSPWYQNQTKIIWGNRISPSSFHQSGLSSLTVHFDTKIGPLTSLPPPNLKSELWVWTFKSQLTLLIITVTSKPRTEQHGFWPLSHLGIPKEVQELGRHCSPYPTLCSSRG